jgi:hypothetical protein
MWRCYKNSRSFNRKLRKESKFGRPVLNWVWRNVGSMKNFDPEEEGTAIIRNTGNCLPVNTAEHPRRLGSSAVPLW